MVLIIRMTHKSTGKPVEYRMTAFSEEEIQIAKDICTALQQSKVFGEVTLSEQCERSIDCGNGNGN